MHLTLLESDHSFFRSAEFAFASIVAHAGVVWLAVGFTEGGRQLPANERDARVFFLLPPDRVDVRPHQSEIFRWGKLGRGLDDGDLRTLPFGPVSALVPDTIFTVLEVDRTVERYEGSAAPAYPDDMIAAGAEGVVRAEYVVDTTGQVDTATVNVVYSDDPRFTESVVTALGLTRFRPAKKAGKPVRQLVEQQFRFRIAPLSLRRS